MDISAIKLCYHIKYAFISNLIRELKYTNKNQIGLRATEALSIRIKDLDLESTPAKLFVRGEYTKTRTDRVVFLIGEIMQQLNS